MPDPAFRMIFLAKKINIENHIFELDHQKMNNRAKIREYMVIDKIFHQLCALLKNHKIAQAARAITATKGKDAATLFMHDQIEALLPLLSVDKLKFIMTNLDDTFTNDTDDTTALEFEAYIWDYGNEKQREWLKNFNQEIQKLEQFYKSLYNPILLFNPKNAFHTLYLLDQKAAPKMKQNDNTELWKQLVELIQQKSDTELNKIKDNIPTTGTYTQKDFIDAVSMYGTMKQKEWATRAIIEYQKATISEHKVSPRGHA